MARSYLLMLAVLIYSIPEVHVALLHLPLDKIVFFRAVVSDPSAFCIEIALNLDDVELVSTQSLDIVNLSLNLWQFPEESTAVFVDISVATCSICYVEISFSCDWHCSTSR